MASDRIERIEKMIEAEPESEILWFSLGQAYLTEGSLDRAVESFEKAVSLKPDYTAVYEQLGRTLEKVGRMEEAREIYRKGVEVGQKTRDMIPLERMTARLRRLEKGPRSSPAR